MSTGFASPWRTPVFALAAILLTLLVNLVVGQINSKGRLSNLDLTQNSDVAVLLDFEPERFHIEAFQEVGRYQGWSDGYAVIMSADPAELRRLARNYWVRGIRPLEPSK